MNQAKVMEVLRSIEWGKRLSNLDVCPSCWELRSGGHHKNCKLAALLDEGEKEKATKEPVVKIWILGPIEGLRLWLVGRAFNLAAWLAGYDVELIIDDGMGNVERLRRDKC